MEFKPIGIVHCNIKDTNSAPRHFSISDEEGFIEVFPEFADGLYRIDERELLTIIFHFHKSEPGTLGLRQIPHTSDKPKGVFALCSPFRPNPIGMSIVRLLKVEGNRLFVRHLDMLDGTPVLDIKPFKPL